MKQQSAGSIVQRGQLVPNNSYYNTSELKSMIADSYCTYSCLVVTYMYSMFGFMVQRVCTGRASQFSNGGRPIETSVAQCQRLYSSFDYFLRELWRVSRKLSAQIFLENFTAFVLFFCLFVFVYPVMNYRVLNNFCVYSKLFKARQFITG